MESRRFIPQIQALNEPCVILFLLHDGFDFLAGDVVDGVRRGRLGEEGVSGKNEEEWEFEFEFEGGVHGFLFFS
jgi:hypothetical protein